MNKLNTFYYIDDKQIRMYLDQSSENNKKHIKKKFTFGVSLAGPKFDTSIEEEQKKLNLYQQITTFEEFLEIKGYLGRERPKSINEAEEKPFTFIHEKVSAVKLIFPKEKLEKLNGIKNIAVWVAEPNPDHLGVEEDWEYNGTFLYLLETLSDSGEYTSVISGVSALLALCNIVHGYNFFDRSLNKDNKETFGRWNYVHPIEKLKSIGAIQIEERKIDTLYRCRYITNEQSYTYNNKKYRVCDLLAYPIYIKDDI